MNDYLDRLDQGVSPRTAADRILGARMADLADRRTGPWERRPGVLLAAVESTRTEPIRRAVFDHAKIVHVMEGRIRLETESGSYELLPGNAVALGAGHWCSMRPLQFSRLWTVYIDENFLRAQMRWILPDPSRVHPRVHPDSWDGSALVLRPGLTTLRRNEPVWRQISVIDYSGTTELITSRLIALFTQTIELGLPSVLIEQSENDASALARFDFPVRGTLTNTTPTHQVRRAVELLRRRMAEPWTMPRLAVEVATSTSHLTRLFSEQVGVAPMRFLIEVRLTEFTRLIEETELSISSAAREVGWVDARVAARWFRRRFGSTPSEYRGKPHPTVADGRRDQDWREIVSSDPANGSDARFEP